MTTAVESDKPAAAKTKKATAAIPLLSFPKPEFLTDDNSPFEDGYSIKREEELLKPYENEQGEVPEDDPMYDRWVELITRRDKVTDAKKRFKSDRGAENVISQDEAQGIDKLGSLVDEEVDQMTIHTKEAYRLFMGRRRDPAMHLAPIVGGRRVASSLRGLWILTNNDNPYADWGLLRHEVMIHELQQRMARDIIEAEGALEAIRRRGLSFSVLKSANPSVLNLGFRSPYGYAISRLIVDYDYFVRLQKTMARKTLKTDDEARKAIASVTRFTRRTFNETTRFGNWLLDERIFRLSRSDFLPSADAEAQKRVAFVTQTFGVVPADVFTAKLQPAHSQRHYQTTAAERELLRTVAVKMEAEAAAAEAADADKPDAAAGLV